MSGIGTFIISQQLNELVTKITAIISSTSADVFFDILQFFQPKGDPKIKFKWYEVTMTVLAEKNF